MRQLGMFAKYWEPGRVKTRLAAAIGPHPAAELYRAILRTLLERLPLAEVRHCVVFSPAEREREFRELLGEPVPEESVWNLEPQAEGDLGARMSAYFTASLRGGCRRVVLVGSDAPLLDRRRVAEAFEQLETHPVVLGPARDGGYYLVGMRDEIPPIFHAIDWSTPAVLEQTRARLAAARIPHAELAPDDDLDDAADLQRLLARLAEPEFQVPELRSLRQAVLRAAAHAAERKPEGS